MLSFGELGRFFAVSALRARPQLKRETEKMVQAGAKVAAGYIGTEKEGWAPLSDATLNGFVHAYGFHIPGKIEKGQTGRISATDPLYATGALKASISGDSRDDGSHIVGTVGSPLKVALWQEKGTANAMYPIPPRPFLGPGLQEAADKHKPEFGHLAASLLVPGIR